MVGALIGLVFGLPSLRLRGLYLAVSTLALHFMVIHAGQEYETRRGHSTGVVIDPPSLAGFTLQDGRAWYFVLLAASVATVLLSLNLLRSKTGRAWRAIHGREAVAEALGIHVPFAKLSAFVVSCTLTSVAGCLFAYYRGFVSAEAFSLFVTIQYVATVIIGGIGSVLGALLGTLFVVLFPYGIEALMNTLGLTDRLSSMIFAINYAAFGVAMILFLVFEPQGLVGIWRRVQAWFLLWPFKQKPLEQQMNDAVLLQLDNVEVTYHRVATAVQGVSLEVRQGAIVALLGTNGAGKTTTLRAISGFIGLDDARVTGGAITHRGERIHNRPPHEITARGITLVPERSKVFESLTVAENIEAVVPRRDADARRLADAVWQYFPALARLRTREAGLPVRRRAPDAGDRLGAGLRAAAAAGRRAVARSRAAGGGGA